MLHCPKQITDCGWDFGRTDSQYEKRKLQLISYVKSSSSTNFPSIIFLFNMSLKQVTFLLQNWAIVTLGLSKRNKYKHLYQSNTETFPKKLLSDWHVECTSASRHCFVAVLDTDDKYFFLYHELYYSNIIFIAFFKSRPILISILSGETCSCFLEFSEGLDTTYCN